jgi:hypothetical protein
VTRYFASIILAVGLVALACSAPLSREAEKPDISPYRGFATWLDNWDWNTWNDPESPVRANRTIADMRHRGVRTLFLATSHHSQAADVVRPHAVSATIEAAHDRGMRVIAWYQPSLIDPDRDYRRSMAAIRFRTSGGERVDSFALDIEARLVRPPSARNARLLRLAARIRDAVGSGYALGAIVPSPRLLDLYPESWPRFPYRRLAKSFDVFLPMAYWTFRASGLQGAYEYTRDSIAGIRHKTRSTEVAVHVIGGTARHANSAETRGFLAAARDCGTLGLSLYDYLTTSTAEWRELGDRPRGGARRPRNCSWHDRAEAEA